MIDPHRFASLPDAAKVWIYAFATELDAAAAAVIEARLEEFLPIWNSHGAPVTGAFELVEGRFLVLAGWCADDISGCSIDSSVRVIKMLRDEHALDGLDRTWIFHRADDGQIRADRRADFREMVRNGVVTERTKVFDTTVQTLGALRTGAFEVDYAASWHARLFTPPAPVAG